MKIEIKIPAMGESIVEATIGQILKPSGSAVKADEEILELETDKVNQVLYAPAAGKIELKVKTGDVVKVGQIVGSVDTEGKGTEGKGTEGKGTEGKGTVAAPQQKFTTKNTKDTKAGEAPTPPKEIQHGDESAGESTEKKSGENGSPVRRKTDDYLAELSKKVEMPREVPAVPRTSLKETRKKMTKLRRVIAQRLVEVKNQTAMLTTFNELDMSAVMQVREKEQENFIKKHGVKLGFMSFFVKACVAALQEFPDVNGRIEGDEIVYNRSCDVSVAVSTDRGLMVPVIRNAELLSYAEIEKELKALAEKARTGTISVDELQGGTFTITNAGIFGSLFSTPILNPPQSAILGMHNIVKRAVVVDDQIVIRPMMYLALSYDHRIVDGKEAVSFLMHIKKNLEEPARLLLDL